MFDQRQNSMVHSTWLRLLYHYSGVIMGATDSQITSLTIVYWTVYSGADQRKHQGSASLAFVRGIHQWPVNSPHKWPVKREIFPFVDIIMMYLVTGHSPQCSLVAIRSILAVWASDPVLICNRTQDIILLYTKAHEKFTDHVPKLFSNKAILGVTWLTYRAGVHDTKVLTVVGYGTHSKFKKNVPLEK